MLNRFARKKVFVTGAGGFIGSHLTEALIEAGCDVTAMIRYKSQSDWGNLEFLPEDKKSALQVVAGSVEDSHFMSRHVKGKDVVFHLAALIGIPYSYIAPQSYVRTNVQGTINILESAREHGVSRVVHTSTSECYGTARYVPIDEAHPLQPQSPYSASKIGADMIADSFCRTFRTPVAILRPFNTFGPRQSARAVIPTIISQALSAAKEIRLGSLNPVRDLTFVKDTVHGFMRMAEEEAAIGTVINIGVGKGIGIGELAKLILELANVNKPVISEKTRERPPESEVFELIADSTKAKKILQWEPRHSLKEGLLETIKFVSQHPHLFRVGSYSV